MAPTAAPPRWDLTPIFAGLDGRDFSGALEGVYAGVDRLVALYDKLDIRATEPRAVADDDLAALESVLDATNELQAELRPVVTYLYGLITTDSRNDVAAARYVELQTRAAPLAPLAKRLGAWLASLDVEACIARSPLAAEHAFALRKAAESAALQMSEHEESLAGELAPSGSLAWQRLHGDVSSQLVVEIRRATPPAPRPSSGCRWRSPAGSRPIPTRRAAAPRTTASSRRGRRWRCRSQPR